MLKSSKLPNGRESSPSWPLTGSRSTNDFEKSLVVGGTLKGASGRVGRFEQLGPSHGLTGISGASESFFWAM
ncbi:MAG: hypothetical protein U0791_21190 [Gemmataceae bacterium]